MNKLVSLTWLLWVLRSFRRFTLHYMWSQVEICNIRKELTPLQISFYLMFFIYLIYIVWLVKFIMKIQLYRGNLVWIGIEELRCMIYPLLHSISIIHNPYHVLRQFFVGKAPTGHNIRPRAHNFVLPIKDNNNIVPRILYNELIT